jgi:hypothetical protein
VADGDGRRPSGARAGGAATAGGADLTDRRRAGLAATRRAGARRIEEVVMKKLLAALLVSSWAPTAALAATWNGVSLIDQMCSEKVKADPDKHPTSCLLKCAKSGYGIQTADGQYIKFDEAGSKMALAELKRTDKKDHIRVNVTGEQKGDVIQVTSLKMAD